VAYRISGGILVLHGKDKTDTQLTTDDKIAFQESMDEFVAEVAEIVDFNKLNVYPNNVEWSGKITELDLEFFFSIGESKGVYINGTMIKLDDDFMEFINKLQVYYEKFKSKWSKVIASRKKTPEQ
jgi:lipoate-protein ligase A